MFASRETERALRQVQWQTTETDEAMLNDGTRKSLIVTTLPLGARVSKVAHDTLTTFDTYTRIKESDGHDNNSTEISTARV